MCTSFEELLYATEEMERFTGFSLHSECLLGWSSLDDKQRFNIFFDIVTTTCIIFKWEVFHCTKYVCIRKTAHTFYYCVFYVSLEKSKVYLSANKCLKFCPKPKKFCRIGYVTTDGGL